MPIDKPTQRNKTQLNESQLNKRQGERTPGHLDMRLQDEGLHRRFGVAARLTIGASLVLAVALFVGGALFSAALSNTNRGQLAEAGRERVNALVSVIEQGAVPATLPAPRDSLLFAQVIGADGKIAGSTQNVSDMELIAPKASWQFASTSISTSKATVDKAGCELFVRSVAISEPAPGRPTGTYYVLVATPVRQSDEMQAALQRQLIAVTPAVLAGAALLFYLLARRALRPVDVLRREVDALSADDLTQRVSAPPTLDEVGRLGRTMNGLLDRIQRFSERQGRFVSDASHELRTPLATTRTRLEVGLLRPTETDWPGTARSLLQENERMSRLVNDLLLLARTGEGAPEPFRTVDLDEIVLEVASTARLGSEVKISVSEVSAGRVLGNPDQLRRVVTNLLDNALRYAESEVRLSLETVSSTHGDETVLRVIDDGPGIAESDRVRVFERFSRLDDDRGRGSGGSGLGLSIVAELVSAHAGFVIADGVDPHGTMVTVRLPASS
jgi:signal transduction histidine kinase